MKGYMIYDVLFYFDLVGMYQRNLFYVPTVNKVLIINGVFLQNETPQQKSQEFFWNFKAMQG